MKYNAFISYSHQQDPELSEGIEKGLEKFAKAPFKRRALSVFRDANHLSAASDLGDKIRKGLENSEYFICLASSPYAESKWCKREIEYWIQNKPLDRFLIAITEGEVVWNDLEDDFDWDRTNALPRILSQQFSGEPLYVDFRDFTPSEALNLDNPKFKERLVMLAATIHGKTVADLTGEASRNHKRLMLIRNMAITVLTILLGLSIWQTVNARKQTRIAHTNYLISEAKFMAIDDPTIGLRLAEEALKRDRSFNNIRDATKIYWENSFYRVLGSYDVPKSVLKFLPDGTGIVAAGNDSHIHILQPDGTTIKKIEVEGGASVLSIACSSDSKLILAGCDDGIARLYDLEGSMIKQYTTPDGLAINAVIFSGSSQEILLGLADGIIYRFDMGGNIIHEYDGHESDVSSLAYAKDESFFVSASYDGSAVIWTPDGIPRATIYHDDVINCVAISNDGTKVFTGSTSHDQVQARLSSSYGEKIYDYSSLDAEITSAEFSHNDKYVLIGSYDPKAHIYDLEGRLIKEFIGHKRGAISVAYAPDGTSIVTGSHDGTVRSWEVRGMPVQVYEGIAGTSYSLDYSPSGDTIMSSSSEKTVLMDLSGKTIMDLTDDSVALVKYSPNGKTLAIGSIEGELKIIDLRYGKSIVTKAHEDEIRSIGFSPSGDSIVTGSWDGWAKLWSISGKPLGPGIEHSDAVSSVAFTPDGQHIMTARVDASLWDLNGNKINDFTGHGGEVVSICFPPKGDKVFTACTDGIGRLWSMEGEQLSEFFGHRGMILSADFSPLGDAVVTVSADDSARIWNLSGTTLQGFVGHKDQVFTVAFSPDGNEIITGSKDNTIRRWRRAPSLDDFLLSGNFQELSKELRKKYQLD